MWNSLRTSSDSGRAFTWNTRSPPYTALTAASTSRTLSVSAAVMRSLREGTADARDIAVLKTLQDGSTPRRLT
jgi:hypothetical protein